MILDELLEILSTKTRIRVETKSGMLVGAYTPTRVPNEWCDKTVLKAYINPITKSLEIEIE